MLAIIVFIASNPTKSPLSVVKLPHARRRPRIICDRLHPGTYAGTMGEMPA